MQSDDITRLSSCTDPKWTGTEFQRDQVLGGRYRVISVLGTGGMGVVYRVEQILLGKELALKTIEKRNQSDVTLRRFQQEARAIFAVDHPNIVSVYDFGLLDDNTPFIVMEIVNGETLGQRLKRAGRLSVEDAIPIFVQVCFGLAHAHENGVVHRDIKPSNIMLLHDNPSSSDGTVKILDFGIAKLSQSEVGEIQALTRTGEVFGSPLYMSPEQCAGAKADHRVDIYSLGCVMFESLTGTPPFLGENAMATMMMHQSEEVPSMKECSMGEEFPQELESLIKTMLEKHPDCRYQNLGTVAHALGALKRGESMPYIAAKPSRTPETQPKTVSMPFSRFSAFVLGIAIMSAATAGVAGYLIHQHQSKNEITPTIKIATPKKLESSTKPFSRSIANGKDGKEYIVFEFSNQVGNFQGSEYLKNSADEVSFPKGDIVRFQPSESFMQNPSNLEVFHPDDLSSLDLRGIIPANRESQIIPKVGRLTGLRNLNISENEINNDALSGIEKLPELQALAVSRTNIDGATLSKLPILKQLTYLEFNNGRGVSDLLQVLKHNDHLTNLFVNSAPLKASDFKTISTIAGLQLLSVNKTGMHDADLMSLSKLTKLVQLDARDCPITKDAIPTLEIMSRNGLQNLTLSSGGFTPTDISHVKKIIPGAKFVVPSAERKDFVGKNLRTLKLD